jgi:hypothetical protein
MAELIDDEAQRLIEALSLAPHPEGGWYRETWRAEAKAGERAAGTAIYFLLEAGQTSQWHQVDADEIWLWHAGSTLELGVADEQAGSANRILLGPDVLTGQVPQARIPAYHWQTARAANGWALVSCIVMPGFEFAGFSLATPETAARLDRLRDWPLTPWKPMQSRPRFVGRKRSCDHAHQVPAYRRRLHHFNGQPPRRSRGAGGARVRGARSKYSSSLRHHPR